MMIKIYFKRLMRKIKLFFKPINPSGIDWGPMEYEVLNFKLSGKAVRSIKCFNPRDGSIYILNVPVIDSTETVKGCIKWAFLIDNDFSLESLNKKFTYLWGEVDDGPTTIWSGYGGF